MTDTVEYEYRLIPIANQPETEREVKYGMWSRTVPPERRAILYKEGWSQTSQIVTEQAFQNIPTRHLQVWRRPLLKK